ncbi:HesA/MoeB/ThiF family protein [Desulfofustis limnaeus]|jgi:molybdopterin/thiamine biosynthesis adenylyltransferase|uniref:Thiamine biosynthesis protein ThiF n=1 Tax=Desulfofustis limnaeus TaxID=2740163 RepID=A0ABM7WCW8_9BACT|nr:ThiF family adenylyltransferase [Desulfofustis limnaeus]MDX9894282.1 ThiF family adenylyltransferase [Desulfofustis sp.]BDD88796.1 thiamine biosynthesis protein ThiF [Desulfofustis limnaeus]
MKEGLDQAVREAARPASRGDGSGYLSLSFAEQRGLARTYRVSQWQVQVVALEADVIPEVYARNQTSLSCRDQLRLLRAHVAIVGLGGLGGTVCEILARIGIGRLTLIDGDRFVDSNLNRQLLSSASSLGKSKAKTAARRVGSINPAVRKRAVAAFLDNDNGCSLVAGATLAVDALDSIAARFSLQRSCRTLGIPLVSAAIAGSSGQATVIFPEDHGFDVIYGDSQKTVSGAEATLGTLPFTAVSLAAIECAEAVAMVIGRPSTLRNRLLFVDLSDHGRHAVDLPLP